MKFLQAVQFLSVLGLTSVFAQNTQQNSSLAPIEVKGNAFFDSKSGKRFYIRGVDYQPGGSSNLTDPLADEKVCSRDIEYFKELGINTVRVYTVDNSKNHDKCMSLLDEAGIYLILDVNTPTASISRVNPACSYNSHYLQNIFATIDAFHSYNNVLGFFAGNEVINDEKTTNTATYVKAVVRDMKKYLKARNYRQIPVGYSSADVAENRLLVAKYFNCGDDEDARVDMLGVNDYSWCGYSSFRTSGYADKMKLYDGYSVPLFLSEFGCNKAAGSRPFNEIGSIYSTQMSSLFSGGLVYEYSMEDSNYGLVQLNGDSVKKLTDFDNLKEQYSKAKNPEDDGGYSTDGKVSDCPSFEQGVWEANNTLPEMPSAASAYFTSGAGQPIGTGMMSQELCDDSNIHSAIQVISSAAASSSSSSSSFSQDSSSAVGSSSRGMAAAGAQIPFIFTLMVKVADFVL